MFQLKQFWNRARRGVFFVLLLMLFILLQDVVLSHIALLGVRAMFLPALVVAVGHFEGGWRGGVFGLLITVTVMLSIKGLSPTVAISVILIAQLLVAACIDAFGWMGQEKVSMGLKQFAGLGLMLGGVVLFKLR